MAPPNEVDKTIHDKATGDAYETATRHEAEKSLKLYAGWFCPFVQRTWITLEEKKIDYQYIEINPYHKDPDFLKLNPRGLVPTLAVPIPAPKGDTHPTSNGDSKASSEQGRPLRPLYESIVIAEYLDEHFADASKYGPRLLPEGDDELAAYERARCRLWIDHISSRIVPAFYRFLQHTPEKNSQYTIDDARSALLGAIKTFVKQLVEMDSERDSLSSSPGPWFLGDRFSLVDITLIPWALRLFLIDHYKKPDGVGIPEPGKGGNDEEIWNRWRTWFAEVQKRDSVLSTMSERDRYIEVYKRYAEDETGSQVGQATRGGSSLP
ncbi:hypothetical protein LTS08_003862 [Lithohypha guttulata]|nr:hypothetical protein LTS08_003862 [Lithohypha guttulata]